MVTRKKIYTLIVDNHDVSIISRQRLLEDLLLNAKLNKKKNKENRQNKRKSLINVNE